MTVREGAAISASFPGSKFFLSLGWHAAVAQDGLLFDNKHPEGIAGDHYPQADDVIQRVICMEYPERPEGLFAPLQEPQNRGSEPAEVSQYPEYDTPNKSPVPRTPESMSGSSA
jgi:hypothetical protein